MIYTSEEVAVQLRLNVETVQRMLRMGKLKGFKSTPSTRRSRWLIRKEDLDDYIQQQINKTSV